MKQILKSNNKEKEISLPFDESWVDFLDQEVKNLYGDFKKDRTTLLFLDSELFLKFNSLLELKYEEGHLKILTEEEKDKNKNFFQLMLPLSGTLVVIKQ